MSVILAALFVTAIGAILAAMSIYLVAKKREADVDLRREKLEYYRAFVSNTNNLIGTQPDRENEDAFTRSSNSLYLFAPATVIKSLNVFLEQGA